MWGDVLNRDLVGLYLYLALLAVLPLVSVCALAGMVHVAMRRAARSIKRKRDQPHATRDTI